MGGLPDFCRLRCAGLSTAAVPRLACCSQSNAGRRSRAEAHRCTASHASDPSPLALCVCWLLLASACNHSPCMPILQCMMSPCLHCSAQLAFGEGSTVLKEGRNATVQGLSGTGSLRVGAGWGCAPLLGPWHDAPCSPCSSGHPIEDSPQQGAAALRCVTCASVLLAPLCAGWRRVPLSLLHPQVSEAALGQLHSISARGGTCRWL